MEKKPKFIKEAHLEYLDELRESGKINMFGARPYLMCGFPNITKEEAYKILVYWGKTFGDRHGKEEES